MDWQNVFMFKQVASQQSWLEPTQSAKVQCPIVEMHKKDNCINTNGKMQSRKYTIGNEWLAFAKPLTRKV